LHHARCVQRVDDLKLAEAWVRHKVASLVEGYAITQVVEPVRLVTKRHGGVLYGIHSCPVLNVVVGMIHHIEDLYLQGDCLTLSEIETAGQSEVDLLCPRQARRDYLHELQHGKRVAHYRRLLDIDQLNQSDAKAAPMADVFTHTPNFTPYSAIIPGSLCAPPVGSEE
jgi:hypothetical protein